jgi:hypothetical protein
VHFDVHGGAGETLMLLTRLLSVQVAFALFGLAVLARVGYLARFVTGAETSAGSYALVCPGVALSVMTHFWLNKGLVATGPGREVLGRLLEHFGRRDRPSGRHDHPRVDAGVEALSRRHARGRRTGGMTAGILRKSCPPFRKRRGGFSSPATVSSRKGCEY